MICNIITCFENRRDVALDTIKIGVALDCKIDDILELISERSNDKIKNGYGLA